MGREAYLARVVLGRSAFDEPLRDENGDFILGGQARVNDDQSYVQQWNARGHPQNLESDRQGEQYRKAQNEVLAACGVINRKYEAEKRRDAAKEVSMDYQLEILAKENNTGFILKCFDRTFGDVLTWWVRLLRMRLLTFESPDLSLCGIITHNFERKPISFLFGGFPAWILAEVARLGRRSEVGEPNECMNYLGYRTRKVHLSKQDQVWEWLRQLTWGPLEVSSEFLSTLQGLGFAVLPVAWHTISGAFSGERSVLWADSLSLSTASGAGAAILCYLVRDHLQYQFGWRTFGLLRHFLHRPERPTEASVQAAELDESVDDIAIVGIGRRLGTYTDARFYGPSSLWPALFVAFPWLDRSDEKDSNMEIRYNVAMRCAADERNVEVINHDQLCRLRALSIVRNAQNLGIDTEEDFYIDVDEWTRDIDHARENELGLEPLMTYTEGGQLSDSFLSTFALSGQTSLPDPQQGNNPAPSTPEQGIRRATALSQSIPRPVRRQTDIEAPDHNDILAIRSEARGGIKDRVITKNYGQSRMTRLTTFSVDSLAWHASSIITSVVLLPVDILYTRSLSSWFALWTGARPKGLGVAGGIGVSSTPGQRFKLICLTFGLECLLRGVVWQVGSRIACHHGQGYQWGQF